MRIKYLGPSPSVIVEPYGPHRQDEEKEYPDAFGAELLATSKKQRFEAVDAGGDSDRKAAEEMTVAELKGKLEALMVAIPDKAKKADLVELYLKATAPAE
jgi:hypothetical protein